MSDIALAGTVFSSAFPACVSVNRPASGASIPLNLERKVWNCVFHA